MAVPVLVFSDFTCPYSYVTEAALRRLEDEGIATVRYAAFELYPAPAPLRPSATEADVDAARPLAEPLGIELRVPEAMPRTRKAHEAAKLAAVHGVGREMRDALFAAHFRDGRDLGRIDVLVDLAAGLVLDATETRVVLDIDTHAAAVDAEEALAARLGIAQVPAMVVGGGSDAERVTGAFPLDALREIVQSKQTS